MERVKYSCVKFGISEEGGEAVRTEEDLNNLVDEDYVVIIRCLRDTKCLYTPIQSGMAISLLRANPKIVEVDSGNGGQQ